MSVFLMLHPICFLPTLYTDTDMSIFGMVIVLAFQICILLMGFTASFSSKPYLCESWHEFPIDLLYKDVSSLDTKWRHGQKFEDPPCPNSQYIGTLGYTAGGAGKARFNVATPTYEARTRPLHVQHTYYRIIFKKNPFNIISRGVQR